MAHNINVVNGVASIMVADKPAWHGLGQLVVGAQTWQDTIRLAGLDWQVSKRQLEHNGYPVAAWGIFRDDMPDAQGFLGAVGDRYTPIQNEYCFDFVDSVLSAQDGAHYESAGALGNGERVWCMARVPYDFKVDGQDPHETFLLFSTSHDGSLAATCRLTTVRVVCQNTLSRALAMNGSFTRIKHTSDAQRKLETAKKMLNNAVSGVKDIQDKLDVLSRKLITKDSYATVMERLFPVAKGKEDDPLSTRRKSILGEIAVLFEKNDNDVFPDFRGTSYNLLNAITEYTDHVRGTRITTRRDGMDLATARRESALFGSGVQFKEQALEVLMDVSSGLADRPYKTYITRAIEAGQAERNDNPTNGNGSLLDLILDSQ